MRTRSALVLALFLLAPAGAQAAAWKPAGAITPGETAAFNWTVDEQGGALFARQFGGALDVRARPRGGPIGPAQTLTSYATGSAPLAANRLGEAVQAYSETDPGPSYAWHQLVALRRPGGDFAAPQTLFSGAGYADSICEQAAAIGDSGEAVVAFSVNVPNAPRSICRVYVAVRSPGSDAFQAPTELPDSASRPGTLQAGMDARGNALVAWVDPTTNKAEVVRHPAGGALEPAQALGPEDEGEDVVAGVFGPLLLRVSAPTGKAILAFPAQPRTFADRKVEAAVGDTTSGFGKAAKVSSDGNVQLRRLHSFTAVAGADGTRAVAWRGGPPQDRRIEVAVAGRSARKISRRDTKALPGSHAEEVAVAMTDQGRVTVAQTRLLRNHRRSVEVATRTGPRRFTKPQVLSALGPRYGALGDLATDSAGKPFLMWFEGTDARSTLHWAAGSTKRAAFGRARRIAADGPFSDVELKHGAGTSMLAAVALPGKPWVLLTYGER